LVRVYQSLRLYQPQKLVKHEQGEIATATSTIEREDARSRVRWACGTEVAPRFASVRRRTLAL
jgi:hypothetical protein